MDEAYAIQKQAVALIRRPVLGWKVARVHPDLVARWGEERLVGPAFTLWDCVEGPPAIPLIDGGYAAAEAEFQLQVRAVPQGPSVTLASASEAIGAIRIGIEIAGSPYAEINRHGPAVTVSDFGNNMGLVLGPAVSLADANEAFGREVTSYVQGQGVGTGAGADSAGGPMEAARFLFELAGRYDLDVRPGHWISAGAITGGHPVAACDTFAARFGDAQVACSFRS
jgi:2-keto-4-pentenoate hydratase